MKIVVLATDNREHNRQYHLPVPYFGTAPEALFQGFARLPEVEVHVVSCAKQPLTSPAKLADNIWFHSLAVPQWGWLRTGYQGCIRAVRKKLRELQPDIVHGQGTERDCALAAVFSGYPNVITIHGNMAEMARVFPPRVGSYGWLTARLETFALRRTAGVLCNSQFTERLVQPRTRRTWRVANALREIFFQPGQSQQPRNPHLILNVGVVCPNKRQLELLEIARRLHEAGLPTEFRFCGQIPPDQNYANIFLERLQSATRAGYASYAGFQDSRALAASFDEAAALIHVPATEAFGLVVAEALARDLKFFGTRIGGIPDIVAGVAGAELVSDGHWDDLHQVLLNWGRQGFSRPHSTAAIMRERYHPAVIARRHLEIYHEVLGFPRKQP